jgi:hypothetical protein
MNVRAILGVLFLFVFSAFIPLYVLQAEKPVQLKYTQKEIEGKWQARIQSFLNEDVIPLIGLLSFLPRENCQDVLRWTKRVMDEEGVALISFAGYWGSSQPDIKEYRWDYLIHSVVNDDPDRFILTTNKGGNHNWWKQKSGRPRDYIEQLEQQVHTGDYPFIGQIEFRHYMSNAQCKAGKTYRDIDNPLDGPLGHRVIRLASETDIPVSIHLEPEDAPLEALHKMLQIYPEAKVIISHFGQIRHPKREQKFTPELVERMLRAHPNLRRMRSDQVN